MKNIIDKFIIVIITIAFLPGLSCKKILDEKPDKSLIIPSAISNYQALLDNYVVMNNGSPSWDEAACDNFYLPKSLFSNVAPIQKEVYTWKPIIYNGPYNDWASIYNVVYIANLVIEGLQKISPSSINLNEWQNAMGSAMFFEAQSYLHGAFIFCKAYDSALAKSDFGMVLRSGPDFNEKSKRSTLEETYQRILQDLDMSVTLLPVSSTTPYRPSRPAAYALLARAYLSMRNYHLAGKYADSCLQTKKELMDYNSLNLSGLNPFKPLNTEVIFQRISSTYSYAIISPTSVRVDTLLYQSYDNNDLRKQAFFYLLNPGYIFKGTYNGNLSSGFFGIATDEVYLMRAECFARDGKITEAQNDLNKLLENRWKTGLYQSYSFNNKQQAMEVILTERRKELVFRGVRWMDIKRLNKEGAGIILKRVAGEEEVILSPGDNRYALPLPQDIINLSGISQNVY